MGILRQLAQHLGAKNLVGGVALTEAHLAAEGAGEIERRLIAHHLRQVVVEIASLLGVAHHEQQGWQTACRAPRLKGKGGESHCHAAPLRALHVDVPKVGARQGTSQRFQLRVPGIELQNFRYLHCERKVKIYFALRCLFCCFCCLRSLFSLCLRLES